MFYVFPVKGCFLSQSVISHLLDNAKKCYNLVSRHERLGDVSGRDTVTGIYL